MKTIQTAPNEKLAHGFNERLQIAVQPERDAELDKIRLDRLDQILELQRQRDELLRLWDSSSAEARRNKANAEALAQALKDLTAEVKLGTLKIRKDFSLINAHASAIKALYVFNKAKGNEVQP